MVAELDALGLLATSSRPNPRDIEFDDLAKLTYLACVVKESMRMFPASAHLSFRGYMICPLISAWSCEA